MNSNNFFSGEVRFVGTFHQRAVLLPMSVGFNSDVTIGGNVCHVQTENHGHPQCRIETLVYHRGRILHRRSSSYSDVVASPGYSESAIGARVENQHRSVIEELRRGAISIPANSAAESAASGQGIQLRLRNANSWLANGFATLDVEVLDRAGSKPVFGANVEAYLAGAKETAHFSATTAQSGLAQLRFAVPVLASDGAELVIRARAGNSASVDEIRYVLRAKAKPNPSESKP